MAATHTTQPEPGGRTTGTHEAYLMERAQRPEYIGNRTYWLVDEYWWTSAYIGKPPGVETDLAHWRALGYWARSRYASVESGKSWNNGDSEMRLYRIMVGLKDECIFLDDPTMNCDRCQEARKERVE